MTFPLLSTIDFAVTRTVSNRSCGRSLRFANTEGGVEEGCARVAFEAPFQRFDFNEYAIQSDFGGSQFGFDLGGVPCFGCGCRTEMLLHGFTAESVVLEVEELRGTLDAGHVVGRCALQSSEDLAASQYPLKLSDKLVEMVLDNAV